MEEAYTDYSKYDVKESGENLYQNKTLKVGDEVVVQVIKPPRGNKGARVTTRLSFVGKNLIYLPGVDFLGISRKITEESVKEEMLAVVEKMRKGEEGFIVRTNAPHVSKKALKKEAEYLKKLFLAAMERTKKAQLGEVVYRDLELPVRVMRDSIGEDAEVFVGDKKLYEKLVALAKLRGDMPVKKISFYSGEKSMFHELGIFSLIRKATEPVVALEGGGYIVVEHTEAMTVVDVNTGKYVGDKSLEETVFSVNMRAAAEVARQVRLRNVGGIVVVDFIDMMEEGHKKAVTAKLEELLKEDKAKCNVLPMSELCLVEFTRKRLGNEVLSYLVKPCSGCHGRGEVPDDLFVIADIRAEILNMVADGYNAVVIELNERIMRRILDERMFEIEANNRWKRKLIYMIPHKTFAENEYTIRGDNSGVLTLPDKAQILY
jgi:ribonuclease G